ncbi:PA14 domain-containing protein [Spirosoma linguale]|uniref:PA14 domain-containing protein n=1 Tax=Spirosoma linguale TaxID=108 RepID=UPI003CC7EF24
MKTTLYLRAIALLCYTPVCLLLSGKQSTAFGQTTYYVANTGNDSNSGRSSDAPYQTISKINSLSLQPGDQVLFRRDDTFTGNLQIKQSGTSDKPIVVDAYGSGNKPVLTGAVGVTAWTNIGNNTWQALCPSCGSRVTGLYRNNTSLPLGRYPNLDAANKGYLTVQSHTGKTQLTSQQSLLANWLGGEVVYRPVQWILNRATITGQTGNSLTLLGSGNYDISDNWGFFIQNHPNTLDQTGEWYYNPSTKTIQLYDNQTNPNTQKITATVFSDIITVSGVSFITIRNLQLTQALSSNLTVTNSSNLVISGNDLTKSGEDALLVKGSGQQLLIENNLIEDANNNGVDIGTYQNVTFRGNIIRRVGLIPGRGKSGDGTYVGFLSATTANMLIEDNTLDNIGYNALNFSANTTIQRNQISNFCLTKSDGSGLYIWNGNQLPMANIRLVANTVTNGIGAPEGSPAGSSSGANGIYLDDCTTNIEVSGNTVGHCKGLGIFLHGSSNITLSGNTSFNNNEGQLAIMSANGCQPRNNIIQNNILVSRLASQFLVKYESNQNDLGSYGEFNNNVYARPFDDVYKILTVYNRNIGASLSMAQWQTQYGKDLTSKNSPITYSSGNADDYLKLLTNPTANPVQVPLTGTYRDARNTICTNQVTIPAYASVVLFKDNTPVVSLRDPENPTNTIAGLDYQYFEGSWSTMPDFNALTTSKTGAVSSPDLSVRNRTDNFGIRFKGYINVPADGVYTFYTSSDDGSKLLIGNTEVVNNDGVHAAIEKAGTIGLKAGKHALTVLYFQGGGGQALSVSYEGPGIGKQAIPATALYRIPTSTSGQGSGTGLTGTYFNNVTLTAPASLTRTDATVNFDWGTGSPAAGTIGTDNFSVRWTGQVEAPVTGNYTFSTTSDDGVRLWVNGAQVINNWTVHAPTTNNSPVVALTAGQRYTIQMEYYDGGAGAVAKLLWAYPGQTQQPVPQSYLYPPVSSTTPMATPPTSATGTGIYLSDLNWTSATNGYGPVEKDQSNGENNAGDGKTITLNGVTYAKGLGVHGLATITYALNGQYSRFLTDIGLDDEVSTCGTVSFDVYLDDVLAYSSGVMGPTTATKSIDLNVSGKQTLKLVATNGGDDASCDHGDWAGARLISTSGARVANPELFRESRMNAYPVPAKEVMWVKYYAETAGDATVQLVNMMGQPVHQATHQLIQGENLLKVMVDQYNRGSYILMLTKDQQRQTQRVILID